MAINLRFFVYNDISRHTSHRLLADTQVDSLAGFNYGASLSLTEQGDGNKPKNYVIADLPFRKPPTGFLKDTRPAFDIYLTTEEEWMNFKPCFSLSTTLYGPSL